MLKSACPTITGERFFVYSNCQKYVLIVLVNLPKVIASEEKQSPRFYKGLLRRQAPRNDRLSQRFFDNRYNAGTCWKPLRQRRISPQTHKGYKGF